MISSYVGENKLFEERETNEANFQCGVIHVKKATGNYNGANLLLVAGLRDVLLVSREDYLSAEFFGDWLISPARSKERL